MKGKKFIAIISIVCILAVILCVPAFATVTESSGDGYALYNGVKLSNINTVWNNVRDLAPYAFIYNNLGIYHLVVAGSYGNIGNPYSGSLQYKGFNEYYLDNGQWILQREHVGNLGTSSTEDPTKIFWSSSNILNYDGSIYLSASAPISLDNYNLIEWDGDTTGLEGEDDEPVNYYVLDYVQHSAFDAFAVMEVSYSTTPIVLDDFMSVDNYGWVIAGPNSSYIYSGCNVLNESVDSDDYWSTIALKFDDVDDTGYTSLIAYRTVESPPGEGGDTPDEPQPPFGATEI